MHCWNLISSYIYIYIIYTVYVLSTDQLGHFTRAECYLESYKVSSIDDCEQIQEDFLMSKITSVASGLSCDTNFMSIGCV